MATSRGERDYTYGATMMTLRTTIGLKQAELANLLGISRLAVVKWEAGVNYPKVEHLRELIILGVKKQAFSTGHEAEEIRALWKVAHQKALLDEYWLSTLLSQAEQPPRSPVVEGGSLDTIPTTPALTLPAQTSADRPQSNGTDKMSKGRRLLIYGFTLLSIIIIISAAGTFLFQTRAQARTYPSYLSGNGTLAFFDPLSREGRWHSQQWDAGGSCRFTGGAYHVSEPRIGYFSWCQADGIFGNFAFEVQLTIIQGNCGGTTFHDDDKGNFYKFIICQDGTFTVCKYTPNDNYTILQYSNNSAIRRGLDQQNKIAVVASSKELSFYINEQQIDHELDNSPAPGHITLIANPNMTTALGGYATDVVYSNARLWTL